MTTTAMNNLWSYIQGLSLSQRNRKWLAERLINPTADDPKTARQKAYVSDTLTRALNEAYAAQRGEIKLQTEEEFLEELKQAGLL